MIEYKIYFRLPDNSIWVEYHMIEPHLLDSWLFNILWNLTGIDDSTNQTIEVQVFINRVTSIKHPVAF